MTTIVTRAGKGLALTYDEMDSNFTNLNTTKLEAGTAATNIANTPTGNIVATNVQAAINELDTEKVNTVNPTTSGTLTHTGQNINVVSTSGMLQLNGTNLLPFGTNTQEWTYRLSAGGTANALTANLGVEMLAYRPGIRLSIYPVGANTIIAPTLALNGLAAKTIKKIGATGKIALVIGDYNQFLPMQLEYDGADFILLNPMYSGAAGTVLQTLTFTDTGASTSSSAFASVTGSAKNLTPISANSTVIVRCIASGVVSAGGAGTNSEGVYTLYEISPGATTIGSSHVIGSVSSSGTNIQTEGVVACEAFRNNTELTARSYVLQARYSLAPATVIASTQSWVIQEVQK